METTVKPQSRFFYPILGL